MGRAADVADAFAQAVWYFLLGIVYLIGALGLMAFAGSVLLAPFIVVIVAPLLGAGALVLCLCCFGLQAIERQGSLYSRFALRRFVLIAVGLAAVAIPAFWMLRQL